MLIVRLRDGEALKITHGDEECIVVVMREEGRGRRPALGIEAPRSFRIDRCDEPNPRPQRTS